MPNGGAANGPAATGAFVADPTLNRISDRSAPRTCPTRTPEPHELGEFPMTCYRCHVEADS